MFKTYKSNFLKIKEYIDIIIQSLIDKIKTLPYTLRCICKVISILIQAKFPKINELERNAFIGEFIFGKCILPTLINSDINAVITTTLLSTNTRQCLRIIAKVLTKINRGLFFEANIDTDYTIFNYYIAEVIPLLNLFYSKLIDVQLPKALKEMIKKQLDNGFGSSNIVKKNKKNKEQLKKNGNIVDIYDNSKRNSRGIKDMHCCICYSIEDILLLLKIIQPKIKDYSFIDIGGFLEKTIEKISYHEFELNEIAKKAPQRYFFLLFRERKNIETSMQVKEKLNHSLHGNDQNSNYILDGIKFCIKKVLTKLNLIDNKDYSYLGSATSNEMFLNAMSDTLQELEEFNENDISNAIPLKWYSGYIYNYKTFLPMQYQDNDYDKLYIELLDEEQTALNTLRNSSSTIITNNGLNIRFAEKIIEKAQKNEFIMKQIERIIKMEQFISKTQLEVCIMKESEIESIKQFKFFGFISKKSSPIKEKKPKPKIIVTPVDKCNHKTNSSNTQKEKGIRHVKTIRDFIRKLGRFNEIKEDILRSNPENRIYETLEAYLEIVKDKLKKDILFASNSEYEHKLILEKISDYIMKNIYNEVFPQDSITLDNNFYRKTEELYHITPAHLEIKALYVNELKYASNCISKIDEGHSAYEKLNFISMAYSSLNHIFRFSSGKDEDPGADEMSPIFQYIIIKANPRRFYSNIQYIKTFLSPTVLEGKYGYLLAMMESSAEFISKITLKELESIKDEFLKQNNNMKC